MKAITVCQPWAELIVSGVKPIENRTWQTPYRGRLAIHAGKSKKYYDIDAIDWQNHYKVNLPMPDNVAFGAIIGIVDLVDCVMLSEIRKLFPQLSDCPFAEGPFCWILKNANRLSPIPCSGQLSIWTTDLV